MTSSKWSAHGNVYLLVELGERRLTAAEVVELIAARAADGLLEVLRVDGGEAAIEIWNRDGSVAEMSGNGTRIAARWLSERAGAPDVRIRVSERVVEAHVDGDEVEQELGEVVVGPRESVDDVELVPVTVGNPHAVVLGDPEEIGRLGPLLESHPRFPARTNVQVARVTAPGHVEARVWERGVGETASSGTSAVAVAAATHGDGEVTVHFPGGDLVVQVAQGRARVRGKAVRVDAEEVTD